MSELFRKIAYARELPRHLRELSVLVGRPVHASDLLSLEQTKLLRTRLKQVARKPSNAFEIPFEAKRERRFVAFIAHLVEENSDNVYIWTEASNVCGLLTPISLTDFRVDFPFDVNPEGILSIVTEDLMNRLLLDYSENNEGRRMLEVEHGGESWGKVSY